MIRLVPALLVPFVACYLVASLFLRRSHGQSGVTAISAFLGIGLATGLSSCTYFLWSATIGTTGVLYCAAELILFAAVGAVAVAVRRSQNRGPIGSIDHATRNEEVSNSPGVHKGLVACLIFVSMCAAVSMLFRWLRFPYGTDDAIAFWNLHARALFLDPDGWVQFFSGSNSDSALFSDHPDYPLLLPASISRLWTYLGSDNSAICGFVSFLFSMATVGLCYAAVSVLRTANQGLLAALALLGTGEFIKQSSSQYADVPLGYAILATVVLFHLYYEWECRRSNTGLLVLAGVTTGLAAWTKNEGLLFAVVVFVTHAAISFRKVRARAYGQEVGYLLLGFLPVIFLSVVYFKTAFAPLNDLAAAQSLQSTLSRLADPQRYWLVVVGFAEESFHLTKGLFFILPAYYFLVGTGSPSGGPNGRRFAVVASILMMSGYFMAYLTTPYSLDWHLHSSLGRLFLHLWPSMIVTYFLTVATPEEVMADDRADRVATHGSVANVANANLASN